MDAEEIISLSAESIADLVRDHRSTEGPAGAAGHRRAPRWPFPGAMQFWLPSSSGAEKLLFGTCCNISAHGLGARTELPLEVGVTLPIAIHLPQASYHGKATVRHCTAKGNGYFVGMEFSFE